LLKFTWGIHASSKKRKTEIERDGERKRDRERQRDTER
jgi:hypothetical protein